MAIRNKPTSTENLFLSRTVYLAIPVVLLTTVLINGVSSAAGWRWDDASILLHVHQFSLLQDFFNPEIWRQLSPSNLTPWLSVSYKLDLTLFGLQPGLFYLHQLAAIAATALGLFILLRLWVAPVFAVFGTGLYLVGTPVMLVAQQLMTRHYIEGLFFCLVSLICFVVYLRTHSRTYLVVSALAYLLAVTAKEVYVPLVVLLPFLPEGRFLLRCKAVVPHAIIALFYVLWRAYMLNSLAGGYVAQSDYFSFAFLIQVAESFMRFPGLLFGNRWPLVTIIYLSLLVAYAYWGRTPLLLIGLVAVLVLAPLAALVRFPGINIADRYLLLPWLAFAFSCAFIANSLSSFISTPRRHWVQAGVALLMATALFVSLLSGINTRRGVLDSATEFDALADFMWSNDSSAAFLPSDLILSSLWYVTDTRELKRRLMGDMSAPLVIVDPKFLTIGESVSVTSLLAYDRECRCMQETSQNLESLRNELAQQERPEASLSLSYSYLSNTFTWQFGPYETGTYHIVSDTIGVTQVPPAGSQRVSLADNTRFFVRYTSPEGWVSYSDLQRVQGASATVNWNR